MLEDALDQFPTLRARMGEPAANLSGGQQQMLTIAMALLSKPRLLMIDELSLGLAPAIVAELLQAVEALKARGTTVILVEQSVNVALTVADTAYFMEKGEIRFNGPTAELLDRPDVFRSVFLEGATDLEGTRREVAASNGAAPPSPAVVHANGAAAANGTGPDEQVADRLVVSDVSMHFGGIAALQDVGFDGRPRRDPRLPRPQRRRQDDPLRRALRLPARRDRSAWSSTATTSRASAPTPAPAAGWALVPGRAPVPGAHRHRDHRRRVRARHRGARPHRRRPPPPVASSTRRRRSPSASTS